MAAPRVRADYGALAQIAQAFEREADQTRAMLRSLKQCQDVLAGGDWIGTGATAFHAEMNGSVLPAVQRLANALEAAGKTTKQISQVMEAAENETAALFRSDGAKRTTPTLLETLAAVGLTTEIAGLPAGIMVAATMDKLGAPGEWTGKGIVFAPTYDFGKRKWDNEPGLELKGQLWEGESDKRPIFGGAGELRIAGGEGGVQMGLNKDGKFSAGVYGEYAAAQAKAEGTLAGDQNLGWTGGVEARVLAAEGFAGIKDNSIGASVGFNVFSVEAQTGVNVAGYNVGVSGELGLKFELGFQIGERTRVRFGPFTVGFNFGKAVE